MLHVCPLSRLQETVETSGARHVITLINTGTPVPRPPSVAPENHLFLGFNDIVEPVDGLEPPGANHVLRLLEFADAWDRQTPLVVHCWAGVSRSTAGAFVIACALTPDRDEWEIAQSLRKTSPKATPNALLVGIADRVLKRNGRMISAIREIGRGEMAFENEPFELPLEV